MGKLLLQLYTEAAMNLGRRNGVLEVICVPVPLRSEIKPCLGILVNKQRSVRADVAKAVVFEKRSFPGIPCLNRQGVRGGSQAEKVHHHVLAVVIPSERQKTDFG